VVLREVFARNLDPFERNSILFERNPVLFERNFILFECDFSRSRHSVHFHQNQEQRRSSVSDLRLGFVGEKTRRGEILVAWG
jgi:hypothetical protein